MVYHRREERNWAERAKKGKTGTTVTAYSIKYTLLKDFIYLFHERGERREKEREGNISVWLPLVCPQLGIWPVT